MAKAITAKATSSKLAEGRKVTKKFVTKLNEFVEVRSLYNLYKKLVDEGRKEIFAEIGEEAQVLTHNGVEVAIITKVTKPHLDQELLKKKFPEAYEACMTTRDEFHIRKATPKR